MTGGEYRSDQNTERPVVIECAGVSLHGILHDAARPANRGVIIVVGGPQYRVGSHRQFVLLARALAAAGFPTLRFDYRGMGDSNGAYLGFEYLQDDISAAITAISREIPDLQDIALWGLCDGATAIAFAVADHASVSGVALVNPWVRTFAGEAKSMLRHYYLRRVFSLALWRGLFNGEIRLGSALRSLFSMLKRALRSNSQPTVTADSTTSSEQSIGLPPGTVFPALPKSDVPLPTRMAAGLKRYRGQVLLITSGNDLTAKEFLDAARKPAWRGMLRGKNWRREELPTADHTFSKRSHLDQMAAITIDWLRSW